MENQKGIVVKSRELGEIVAQEIVRAIPLDRLHISDIPGQRHPKANEVAELALSLKNSGQTTPAIVRPHPKRKGDFEIVAGSRRKVAAESLGWRDLNAVVRPLNDDDFELQLLVENMQREDVDPCEEVKVIERLQKRGVKTPEQISAYLGKPIHWSVRRLKLLNVIPEIRQWWERGSRRFDGGNFDLPMMELIGSFPVPTQKTFLKEGYWFNSCQTRSELEKAIERNVMCRLDRAPFDLNDKATFINGCGPGCACDSSKQANLFDLGDKAGRCLNPTCFRARAARARTIQLAALEKEHGKKLPVVSNQPRGRLEVEGGHLEPRWAQVAAKPTKENTVKAIVVGEKGDLSVGYIRKQSAAAPAIERSTYGGPKPGKKTLAQKKSALQARRWKLVHTELCETLQKSTFSQCTETIEDLVAIFGLAYKAQAHERSEREGSGNPRWRAFDHRKKQGYPTSEYLIDGFHQLHRKGRELHKDRRATLWNGLKPVLLDVMGGWFNVGDIHRAVPDMRRVAKLLDFKIDERKRAADLTIKVPRTWGQTLDVHTLEPVEKSLLKLKRRKK